MTTEQALAQYGLSRKETIIYLCLLKSIELSAFELAKKTEIPRTSVYSTLEILKKKGLVTSFIKNNATYYTPENPKQLLRLLQEKEQVIQEALPDMINLIDTAGKNPSAKLYLGEEGVKMVFEDVLETINNQNLPSMQAVSQLDVLEAFPRFFPDWQKRRHSNNKTFTQLIVPGSARDSLPELFKSREDRETRFFPERFVFSSSLEIYGSKTATISLKDGEFQSIIIDSPAVTNTFKQFFLFAWNMIGENKT